VKLCTERAGARLIVNDRADVARLVGAAGVHLGQQDLPPDAARAIVGPDAVVGLSTHNAAQLDAALRAGAVHSVAFAPLFPTGSKRGADPVRGFANRAAARAGCRLPLVAIGGIDRRTITAVLASGVDAAAVIGALAGADDAAAATRDLLAA